MNGMHAQEPGWRGREGLPRNFSQPCYTHSQCRHIRLGPEGKEIGRRLAGDWNGDWSSTRTDQLRVRQRWSGDANMARLPPQMTSDRCRTRTDDWVRKPVVALLASYFPLFCKRWLLEARHRPRPPAANQAKACLRGLKRLPRANPRA